MSGMQEVVKKKRTKRTDIPVSEVIVGGLSKLELQKAEEKEYELAHNDKIMEDTKDSKNAVEAYVYDMRNKLFDKYRNYATETEREELSRKLQQTEDWLYEEGDDETRGVYNAKLEELKKIGDPIEQRYKEEEARNKAARDLMYYINSYRNAALSKDVKFDHIDLNEKEKVLMECSKAEEWLREKIRQQDATPKCANPILLSGDIRKKAETLDMFCKPIMTKPKPTPQKPVPKAGDAKDSKGNGARGGEQSSEPMDTDHAQDPESMQTE